MDAKRVRAGLSGESFCAEDVSGEGGLNLPPAWVVEFEPRTLAVEPGNVTAAGWRKSGEVKEEDEGDDDPDGEKRAEDEADESLRSGMKLIGGVHQMMRMEVI